MCLTLSLYYVYISLFDCHRLQFYHSRCTYPTLKSTMRVATIFSTQSMNMPNWRTCRKCIDSTSSCAYNIFSTFADAENTTAMKPFLPKEKRSNCKSNMELVLLYIYTYVYVSCCFKCNL